MSFQVRHKDFGIFQGEFLGMHFWYPMSDMPEQGIYESLTKEDAQKCIDFLSGDEVKSLKVDHALKREDLEIEDFNENLNQELILLARCKTTHN